MEEIENIQQDGRFESNHINNHIKYECLNVPVKKTVRSDQKAGPKYMLSLRNQP